MSYFAVIVAAGLGSRYGGKKPKQFSLVDGFIPIRRVIDLFVSNKHISGILPVIPNGYRSDYFDIVSGVSDRRLLYPVIGGETRQKSVKIGLEALYDYRPDYVVIHDVARCYCSKELLERVINAFDMNTNAVIPVLNMVDSVISKGHYINRDDVKLVQTPQAFRYETLLTLHRKYEKEQFTDDASLFDKEGMEIKQISGEISNVKLTYKSGSPSFEFLTGYGYDAHRFSKNNNRKLILMGLTIDGYIGLEGVSDADVGIHSLVDAILGALCLGSIGDHFPANDIRNTDRSSVDFLKYCNNLIEVNNAQIVNIDTTIVCEEPKVSKYRDMMKSVIAECLGITSEIINIKGKTTEGMGFEGRREGISAVSIVTIRKRI